MICETVHISDIDSKQNHRYHVRPWRWRLGKKKAPVTPTVVEWAVGESGYALSELARKLGHPKARLEAWIEGSDQPTQAQLRNFAREVRRPSALFYLPEPPETTGLPPSLRSAPGLRNRKLSPAEIAVIRRLTRCNGFSLGCVQSNSGRRRSTPCLLSARTRIQTRPPPS